MRAIIFILTLILLAGCSSTRKLATHSEQIVTDKTVSDVRSEQKEQATAASSTVTMTTTAEADEVVTIRREYDTNQPADAVTGKPPLKSETISHKSATRNLAQQQTDSASLEYQATCATVNNTKYDTTTQAKNQVEETHTRRPTWWLWLSIAGAIVVVYKTKGLWMRRG